MQETQETQAPSLGREDPLEEEMAARSSILAGNFRGQRSLAGYSPWGHKKSDTTQHTHIHNVLIAFTREISGNVSEQKFWKYPLI